MKANHVEIVKELIMLDVDVNAIVSITTVKFDMCNIYQACVVLISSIQNLGIIFISKTCFFNLFTGH